MNNSVHKNKHVAIDHAMKIYTNLITVVSIWLMSTSSVFYPWGAVVSALLLLYGSSD